jgi:hypothetical protein
MSLSCSKNLTQKEIQVYTEKGNLIVKKTAGELSGELMTQMKTGGIPLAISYCNTAALPLTSAMSKAEGVQIKRTSHKVRNPLNSPSENELLILRKYQQNLASGIPLEPIVELNQKGVPHYYAPIMIDKKCLVCHGTLDQELSKAADSIIKSRYPKDLATGFKEGDLRGIWSISFSKPAS